MSSQMRLLSIGFLVTLAFAAAAMALGTASDSPVGAASIPHSYIMALDADTTKDTRDQIVKTLEAQGAKVRLDSVSDAKTLLTILCPRISRLQV